MSLEGKYTELETIMLNEINQNQKNKYTHFSLTCRIWERETYKQEGKVLLQREEIEEDK